MNVVEKVRIFTCTNVGNLARRLGSWGVRPCFLGAMVLLALLSARAQQESMQKAAPNGAGAGPGDPVLYRHYKGLKAMGVEDAWKMGVTGKGVNVAVIDDGIDFGNADLYGSQARVATQRSPYYGWPIVIDTWSIT